MSKKGYIINNRNEGRSECKCRPVVLRKSGSALQAGIIIGRALCGSGEGVIV